MKTQNLCFFLIMATLSLNLLSCNIISSKQDDRVSLEPVNGANSQVEDLVGPTWTLEAFQTSGGDTLKFEEKNKYTVTFLASDSVSGSTECNDISLHASLRHLAIYSGGLPAGNRKSTPCPAA